MSRKEKFFLFIKLINWEKLELKDQKSENRELIWHVWVRMRHWYRGLLRDRSRIECLSHATIQCRCCNCQSHSKESAFLVWNYWPKWRSYIVSALNRTVKSTDYSRYMWSMWILEINQTWNWKANIWICNHTRQLVEHGWPEPAAVTHWVRLWPLVAWKWQKKYINTNHF